MIKNILFDIGGVLVKVDFDGAYRRLTGADDEKLKRLRHAFFDNGTWDEVDRGVLNDEELVASFIDKEPELEDDIRCIWDNLNEVISQYDYSIDWIEGLKNRGFKTYYLSNWSYHLREVGKNDMTFIPHLDGGVYSCDVKLLKPDRRIYECIAEKYGLEMDECVFLDDNIKNVEGAIACGMHGITVRDYEETAHELERLLEQENKILTE